MITVEEGKYVIVTFCALTVIMLTGVNMVFTAIMIKLYTEFAKQRMQEVRGVKERRDIQSH